MEAVNRPARVPIARAVKQSFNKGKVTRQPLYGIGNKNSTLVARKPLPSKAKPESKEVKQVKQPAANEASAQVKKVVEVIAFSAANLPEDVEAIDKDDESNPQLVSCFVNEIYQYLRKLEARFPLKKGFLKIQPEITGNMRAVLISWLVQVHNKFRLLQETLYLTVSLIDRFLQIEIVRRQKLQLVGVTAMFIACKYEEMYAPEVGDFVYITDHAYTKQEILKTEIVMLHRLDFSLGKPLPLHFLRRNSKAGNVDSTMHALAKYIMELLLLEYELVHYLPSMVAGAALYLSIKLLENGEWTPTLAYYSGYKESDLMPLVCKICKMLLNVDSSRFQAVRDKYASSKLLRISALPELSSPLVKTLAEQDV